MGVGYLASAAGLVISLTVVPVVGIASQYAEGVMETVIRNRQAGITSMGLPAELPKVAGYVAVEDCGRIGEVWLLRVSTDALGPLAQGQRGTDGTDGEGWERFLVADCAGSEETREWMREKNILVEVDYLTAERWGCVGRGVTVEVLGLR